MLDISRALPNGVAQRLRVGFAAVIGLIIGLFAIGWVGLLDIKRSYNNLVDETAPALSQAGHLSYNIEELLRFASEFNDTESIGDFDNKKSELDKRFSTLHRILIEQVTADPTLIIKESLDNELLELWETSTNMLEVSEKISQLSRLMEVEHGDLEALFDSIHEDIETLTVHASILDEEAHHISGGNQSDHLETIESVFSFDAVHAHWHALAQLALRLDSARGISESVSRASNHNYLELLENRLQYSIRGLIQLLATMPAGPDRTSLARQLKRMRTLIFESDGLLEKRHQYLTMSDRLGALRERKLEQIKDASRITSRVFEEAESAIENSAASARQTFSDVTLKTGIGGIVLIVLLGGIFWFVVEKQINRRMSQLTTAVRKIAGGAHGHKVRVDGTDELGEMAAALEVFKSNAKELQRSNSELSRFAYAAAHDLRSPLRGIRDLVQWTIEDAEGVLPQQCRSNLDLITTRVDRLSQLLAALLDYARVGREQASIGAVDIRAAALEINELLSPDKSFVVSIEASQPIIITYEAPLRQILLNLMSNAIKHHDKEHGEILLSVAHDGNRLQISVADDGPGIEAGYHDQIFGLFQTLKSRDLVEGSGLGLAIIRKLVEHYEGEIWVESEPHIRRGAKFVFNWPCKHEPHSDSIAA